MLDYGCAHGGYCVNLRNEIGRKWIGVDVDKHSLAWARKNFIERGPNDGSMRFMLADRLPWALFPEGETGAVEADAALMLEVLEHAREPWLIIEQIEACVKPGGQVLISVPYGPWEYDSYRTYPHPRTCGSSIRTI